MKKTFFFSLIITISFTCSSQGLKIYPLHPYSVLKSGSCTKYFIINNEPSDADSSYSILKLLLDSSEEERFFISQCRLTEYIYYKTSAMLDTSYRDTLPNNLSKHAEDLRAKIAFKAGKPFLFTFYEWKRTVFFVLDDTGKIISRSMQKAF